MAPLLSYHNKCFTLFIIISSNLVFVSSWDRQSNQTTGRGYSPCEQSSCYPATGNLLIGRENRLKASSTCGLLGQERYCIVSHLEERKKCFWCDSRPQNANNPLLSHRIENIVYTTFPGTKQKSWWQAENGKENVSIQLDLEAEFHFTHLIATFKTFRPAAMLIERSYDFGKTWQVYRYFAHKCEEAFPHVSRGAQRSLTDVVCDERYSSVAPSTDGEIILRVLAPNLHHLYDDPYSQEVQNLLKMTNLRINFTKLHTLGDDLLDNREEIREKYYYAITEMVVRGSCSCYGHASRCLPQYGVESKQDMVHGQCECTHNTKGLNCERCEDFFNDFPWKPAFGKQTNACKRCNCNNHATRCHFDQNVFESTGHTTGGVCDDCQHNTIGRNCEQCKPGFYHDPSKDFADPEACQPCDCELGGSLDNGICDSTTDLVNSLESGRCHCKKNVEGRRCDYCKPGFWNFDESNPEGCQECTCNTLGTQGNEGCDVISGECICKRFVIGRDCNQCLPQHWGLSDSPDGCKPCDCDIGGSIDGNCNVLTGQCRCRPHLTGRRCDIPEQSFFAGHLDFLVYEAENTNCTDINCQVAIREPFRDGQPSTWTGTGFMRAYENTELVFNIDDIKTSMDYDLVIRYEPQFPGQWDDVKVIIDRDGPIDVNGPCGNSRPDDDYKDAYISSDSRHTIVVPPVCLESGKKYKVRLQFKQFGNQVDSTPSASILVDSIVLIPRVENLPFFQSSPQNMSRLKEYEHYRCREQFLSVAKGEIPDVCKKYDYNIGFYVFGGAFSCDCDLTGSVSTLCSPLGGKCQCKPNVEGRRCDHCAPGTYGFGPEGCKSCDCNSVGALDNFCDVNSGQCTCRLQTYGRECDQCQPGSWNYPNCQRCQCNGHADTCHPHTGACNNCQMDTTGHSCERCIEGYYGDPRLGIDIPCRPCPCPGTVESGHSYADRCNLDSQTQDVVCECQEGYAGSRCDVCADNYFGNPEEPGGGCESCNCSSNIDISRPGNCDPHTGECLQCLFETEGFNCQICKANFFGDALSQSCRECVCDILGTNLKAGPCDRSTGQCPCLPNVVGQKCDQCKPNHWKIASGTGCEPCDCDPIGSTSDQCNQFDGQCSCKTGFGGRQCNECQQLHWGDPNVECHKCECNPDGSATLQCHQNNGTCKCMLGIGGDKCDKCARGFLGNAPQCSPCGECFDAWDRILTALDEETKRVISAAKEIKRTGATGAYTQEFETMEKRLDEVKELLQNTKKSSVDLSDLENIVKTFRSNLTTLTDQHNSVGKLVEDTTQRIYLSNLALANLRNKTMFLEETARNLKDNATRLQESNVEGALNLTREALRNSLAVQHTGAEIQGIVADAERQCKRTDNLVSRNSKSFTEGQQSNEANMNILQTDVTKFEQEIPVLNQQVCDKRGDPCDALCGGAGCGFCGGISCEDGAVTKAEEALKFAKDAEKNIREKEASAEELFRGISQAKAETAAAHDQIKKTYDLASQAKNNSESAVRRSSQLADDMEKFLNSQRATPAEIRNVAADALSKNIILQPEQITDIAKKINDTIASRTDINKILADTSDNLILANQHKEEADNAKEEAEKILKKAQSVVGMLDEAEDAQNKALSAIETASNDIAAARKDLTQTASETREAQQKANETVAEVKKLHDKLKTLQTSFLKNDKHASAVADEVDKVDDQVKKAQLKGSELRTAYKKAADSLEQRGQNFSLAHARAQKTLERASKLFVKTNAKLKELKDAEATYLDQETTLDSLTYDLDQLNSQITVYLSNINEKSKYYRNCLN